MNVYVCVCVCAIKKLLTRSHPYSDLVKMSEMSEILRVLRFVLCRGFLQLVNLPQSHEDLIDKLPMELLLR